MPSPSEINAALVAIEAYVNRAVGRVPILFRGTARKYILSETGNAELWQAAREALEAAEKVREIQHG